MPLRHPGQTIIAPHLGAAEENEYFYAWLEQLPTLLERQQQIVRAAHRRARKAVAGLS